MARQGVHALRGTVDAIMVGVNTVVADDPQLTVRDDLGKPTGRQPLRLIVDSTARIPLTSRVVTGELPGATAIIVGPRANKEKLRLLQEQGNTVISVPEVGRPILIGGREAPGPVGGRGVETLAEAVKLKDVSWEPAGKDLMILGYVERDVHGDS
jgi:diaminohydroxyphosphoribosylaminopyrimidine deaminase/5-amino-6-(5-phosphoribosylamino)uracil reductase